MAATILAWTNQATVQEEGLLDSCLGSLLPQISFLLGQAHQGQVSEVVAPEYNQLHAGDRKRPKLFKFDFDPVDDVLLSVRLRLICSLKRGLESQ